MSDAVPEPIPQDNPSEAVIRDLATAEAALLDLSTSRDPELAGVLARLFGVVAAEAARGPRFANALNRALQGGATATPADRPKRAARRRPGPFDPFAVYAESEEGGLRQRLEALDLEQLRDIIAEHGMDSDRLAMKWKDPQRVTDRIVERVVSRAAKGSAFQ